MRTRLVFAVWLLACLAGPIAAQQPGAPDQPGLKWSDDQIKKTAHHVRAGRKLTPKTLAERRPRRRLHLGRP